MGRASGAAGGLAGRPPRRRAGGAAVAAAGAEVAWGSRSRHLGEARRLRLLAPIREEAPHHHLPKSWRKAQSMNQVLTQKKEEAHRSRCFGVDHLNGRRRGQLPGNAATKNSAVGAGQGHAHSAGPAALAAALREKKRARQGQDLEPPLFRETRTEKNKNTRKSSMNTILTGRRNHNQRLLLIFDLISRETTTNHEF